MNPTSLGRVTWIVKAGIYVAFAFSILLLIYYALGFVYALTSGDHLRHSIAVNLYVMPQLGEDLEDRVFESRSGAVRFRFREAYALFTWLNMPRRLAFVVYFKLFVLWGFFFIGIRQLANVFENVGEGKPFVPENAGRLRVVGLCMLGSGFFKILYNIGTTLVFRGDILIPGARLPWLFIVKEEVNLGIIFGGLVVLAISEVFRIGNALQEDQELTV